MHLQPVYLSCRVSGGSVSEELFQKNGLCLPSGSKLSQAEPTRIVGVVREVHQSSTTSGVTRVEAI